MKQIFMRPIFSLLTLLSLFLFNTSGNAQTKPWVDGYYTGYGSGTIPANQVDYSAMSVVIDFAVVVSSNGSLDATSNGVSSIAASSVADAHAAGDKIIVSFGGAGNGSAIASAISSNLSTLVSNVVAYVKNNNFDGCDIDMEPVGSGITSLVQALRAQLPSPTYIITATSTGDAVFGQCYQYIDQINLMTYDLAGNWQGWVSWYNGSLHTYGTAATNGSEASANCDAMVNTLTKAGVPASKIGIGSEFGGAVWSGVTVPNQTGCTSVSYDVPYNTIKGYGGTYTWDPQAQASYTVSSKGW
ncbi:MAG: glycoside hydrolase family 18 protein, partial [Candidatus Kryptoniota bacterium]